MKIKSKKYAQALYHALREAKPFEYQKIFTNFIKALERSGLLSKSEWILSEFSQYFSEHEGIMPVSLTSFRKLESDELEYIVKKLEKTIEKKVEISATFDPEILGSLVMRIGDTLFDGSLRTQLMRLLSLKVSDSRL